MANMIPYGNVRGLIVYQQSLNPAEVAANTTAEQDFTVTGVLATDVLVSIKKPTATAGLGIVGWRVKAANTVSVTFVNATASPIDAGAETYVMVIARPDNNAALTNLAF